MRALNRKLVRDLWRMRTQVLAIAVVIASGVAVLVMARGTVASLEETRDAYYERYRFGHVFAYARRAPERLARRIAAIPGVRAVETRIVETALLDLPDLPEPATGRLVSVPERRRPRVNDLVLRAGRWPSARAPDEVLVGEAFAEAHGLVPDSRFGAIVNGRRRTLSVVGIALSPEYLYAIAPGALLPDEKRYGVVWMGREALAEAFDLDGAFNDVSLTVDPGAAPEAVIDRLDALLARYGGTGAYPRRDQLSNWFLSGEIAQLRLVSGIMPTIFLAVGAFLLNVVIGRLVMIERQQIGLLKAFGYGNGPIARHYLGMALVIAVVGIVAGAAVGAWLGRGMTGLYAEFYRFPFLYYRPHPGVFGSAAAVALGAAVVGALKAVLAAARLTPAQAILPPLPEVYRRRGPRRLLGRLDLATVMVARHVARWPLRSGLTMLGIAMSTMVLVTALHWLDAIDHLLEVQFFQAERESLTVTFFDERPARVVEDLGRLPGVLAVEPVRRVAVRFRAGSRERRGSLTGVVARPRLSRVLDVRGRDASIPPDGLVLSSKLAELLGVGPGDHVRVAVTEGRRPTARLPVVSVFETYLGTPAYIGIAALNRLMGEPPTVSAAHLAVDPAAATALYRALKATPAVASVTLRSAVVETFRRTLAETILIIISFYIAFAGALALGVVYNSARVALSERGRVLASLRVLGFTRAEIAYILLGELAVVTVGALPLGCFLGLGLSWLIGTTLDTELYRIPLVVERSSYGIAVAATLAAAVASGIAVARRLARLDLMAVLKTRE